MSSLTLSVSTSWHSPHPHANRSEEEPLAFDPEEDKVPTLPKLSFIVTDVTEKVETVPDSVFTQETPRQTTHLEIPATGTSTQSAKQGSEEDQVVPGAD